MSGAVIYAIDIVRVATFYRRTAGLTLVESTPGYQRLQSQGYELVVVRVPDDIAAEIVLDDPAVRREDTALKLMFAVTDIAAAREAAAECGGVVDPPEREWAFAGATVCDGHDPEGNVIQLRQ